MICKLCFILVYLPCFPSCITPTHRGHSGGDPGSGSTIQPPNGIVPADGDAILTNTCQYPVCTVGSPEAGCRQWLGLS